MWSGWVHGVILGRRLGCVSGFLLVEIIKGCWLDRASVGRRTLGRSGWFWIKHSGNMF